MEIIGDKMSLEQKKYLLHVIRGYHFAYKATKQINYKVSRDKIIKQLRDANKNNILYIVKVA